MRVWLGISYQQTWIRPGRKATDIPKSLLNPETHMKQTKLPKGKKKTVICNNCANCVGCDECGVALHIGQCSEKYHIKKAQLYKTPKSGNGTKMSDEKWH